MSETRTPLLVAVLALVWQGCSSVSEKFAANMLAAEIRYQGRQFGEAADRYRAALEEEPDNYAAVLGLANSASEYSIQLYDQGAQLLGTKSPEVGAKQIAEADKWAQVANRYFTRALRLQDENGDEAHAANYGYALFFYVRSTLRQNVPYPESPEPPSGLSAEDRQRWVDGYRQRRLELDKAIEEFETVLKDDPKDMGAAAHPAECRSNQSHRYLGLALFLRSDWNRRDGERAREHLTANLAYLIRVREGVLQRPQLSDLDRMGKEKDLRSIGDEIQSIRQLIRDRLDDLKSYEAELKAGKDQPRLPPAEREKRLAAVATEIVAVSELVRQFEQASPGARPDGTAPQGKP